MLACVQYSLHGWPARQPYARVDFIPPVRTYEFAYCNRTDTRGTIITKDKHTFLLLMEYAPYYPAFSYHAVVKVLPSLVYESFFSVCGR
jgi:hypothetical protein